jgi:hypothetical protein
MKNSPQAGQKLSFEAKLENWEAGMNYCAVAVPAKITAALGTNGPVLVNTSSGSKRRSAKKRKQKLAIGYA